jgi:hypothetical protein
MGRLLASRRRESSFRKRFLSANWPYPAR